MYNKFIFLIIMVFEAQASLPDNDPMDITFKILTDQSNTLTCDHSDDKKQQNTYTVLEGEEFTIVTKYEHVINHFICHAYTYENNSFNYKNTIMKNETTFRVDKTMGTLWNCTILTHRDNTMMKPVVHYKKADYVATYCFMKLHVRQKEPPQTMLVNQMLIPAVRKDLSEKDVDFIAEYQYEDGDVVNVACVSFLTRTLLTMEYKIAGITNDAMRDMSSSKMIGFKTKLHSGHNNSYVICTSTEPTDYTKVMLRFVMKTKLNIISIAINGMILRPILKVPENNLYEFECKFAVNQPITVTCEVEQTDVQLVVLDGDLDKSRSRKTELIPNKKTEIRFYLNPGDSKSLPCGADYVVGGLAESVYIRFTTANFPIDEYPSVHMDLPSSGTVMELYSYGDYKRTVILNEFQRDETLQLTCGPLHLKKPGPLLYLQLTNNEICRVYGCNISTTLQHGTGEHVYPPIVCYLKEEHAPELPSTTIDTVVKEVRVILRERTTDITSLIINKTEAGLSSYYGPYTYNNSYYSTTCNVKCAKPEKSLIRITSRIN